MTFILGQSRLTYDHLGDYPRIQAEAIAQLPLGVVGDSCLLGEGSLGTYSLCEIPQDIELEIEVL